jgi:hypothetical protein
MRFDPGDYAELLGLYLGDGHIVRMGRTYRLRIFLDSKYPVIVADAEALLRRCWPENSVDCRGVNGGRMTILSVYSKHLPCLFPQHGPGPKHDRLIALEDWQQRIATDHPWRLLTGLIRSDGCSFTNRTGRYEYLSYHFANRSYDITRIFQEACEHVGVQYRCVLNKRRDLWEIRINRRSSVALVLEHVGVKE